MHFELLADRVEAVPIVARWHFDEWGKRVPENSFEKTCDRLNGQLNRDRLPLMVLAVEGDDVVGVAELKPHEMLSLYPDKTPWLGGVFVAPSARGKSVASQLVLRMVEIAVSFGIEQLHLQTVALDGGLYARLGWKPIEQVHSGDQDVLVMVKKLVSQSHDEEAASL